MRRLILASTSTARAAILAGAGVTFEAIASGVDEGEIKARLVGEGHGPLAVARTLAARKAVVVSRRRDALVMGADQTLECEGTLLDKAASAEEARGSLLRLRGRGISCIAPWRWPRLARSSGAPTRRRECSCATSPRLSSPIIWPARARGC